ncbi:MAG: glycosyltransferase family 4 protein [Candidatus Lokiarchaeia archaeon]
MTTVHPLFDVRIFQKQAKTLAGAGHDVSLIVQHSKDETIDGIKVIALSKPKNRFFRVFFLTTRAYRVAVKRNADIYYLHDPELVPVGILLKFHSKRVVYDVHEDSPAAVLSKLWIYPWLRYIVAKSVAFVEKIGMMFFDGIVTATPVIAERFPTSKTITVQNFPILNELVLDNPTPYKERKQIVAYVGNISELRGAKTMVEAVGLLPEHLGAQLWLAGVFSPANLGNELKYLCGWKRVEFRGWQSRKDLAVMLAQVRIGLVLFHKEPNYVPAYPTKLFEYMSAGIPVIASDFPIWREIVEGVGCGMLVDPSNPKAIAGAIQWLLEHPEEAEAMGGRGQAAVREWYNWDNESKKLLGFCKNILK